MAGKKKLPPWLMADEKLDKAKGIKENSPKDKMLDLKAKPKGKKK